MLFTLVLNSYNAIRRYDLVIILILVHRQIYVASSRTDDNSDWMLDVQ